MDQFNGGGSEREPNIMSKDAANKLAKYVKRLDDFIHYETYDGDYNHMHAIVADAVLQRNMKYESHVRPRIDRIRKEYADASTTSAALRCVNEIGASKYLGWAENKEFNDRCLLFNVLLAFLKGNSVETQEELKNWLQSEHNVRMLKFIEGVGPKTVDYLKILVGIQETAIDRHLINFAALAGIENLSYDEAHDIIKAAANMLELDLAKFDHSIWQYMRKKAVR